LSIGELKDLEGSELLESMPVESPHSSLNAGRILAKENEHEQTDEAEEMEDEAPA